MRMLPSLALALSLLAAAAPAGGAPAGDAPAPILYRYQVVPERSRVSFSFTGLVLPQDAYFGIVRGEILLGGGDSPFQGASGWIRVETASVRAGDPLQERMLREAVLDAGSHPWADLRVSEGKPLEPPEERGREKDWEVEARGTLQLHGVGRAVPLRFRVADTGTDLYLSGEGRLLLSDFGMSRPTVLLVVPGSGVVNVKVRLVARPVPPPPEP